MSTRVASFLDLRIFTPEKLFAVLSPATSWRQHESARINFSRPFSLPLSLFIRFSVSSPLSSPNPLWRFAARFARGQSSLFQVTLLPLWRVPKAYFFIVAHAWYISFHSAFLYEPFFLYNCVCVFFFCIILSSCIDGQTDRVARTFSEI